MFRADLPAIGWFKFKPVNDGRRFRESRASDMINLHERLSEFSYGYGCTREVENLLRSIGLRVTPFLPNLIHEATLGFDVSFQAPGRLIALQFKLGQELRRFHRSPPTQTVPALARPFWRFNLDLSGDQFLRLKELEDNDAEVYYLAPRFSNWISFQMAFQTEKVLERSLRLTPNEILMGASVHSGAGTGVHRIVYDDHHRYIFSEPVALKELSVAEIIAGIEGRLTKDRTLDDSVRAVFNRPDALAGPGRITGRVLQNLLARARSPIEGMAAAVGMEAWSMGAQLLFVTRDPEAHLLG